MPQVLQDNYDRFVEHDEAENKTLDELPRCDYCYKHIQQEQAVYLHDEWICDECLDEFRRDVCDG